MARPCDEHIGGLQRLPELRASETTNADMRTEEAETNRWLEVWTGIRSLPEREEHTSHDRDEATLARSLLEVSLAKSREAALHAEHHVKQLLSMAQRFDNSDIVS